MVVSMCANVVSLFGHIQSIISNIESMSFVLLQMPVQRPTAVATLTLPGDIARQYPVDVQCIIEVHGKPGQPNNDFALLQVYEFVFSPTVQHAYVPAYPYVYLGDTFELLPVSKLLKKALLVPNIDPTSARNGSDKKVSTRDTQKKTRPTFFWVNSII